MGAGHEAKGDHTAVQASAGGVVQAEVPPGGLGDTA